MLLLSFLLLLLIIVTYSNFIIIFVHPIYLDRACLPLMEIKKIFRFYDHLCTSAGNMSRQILMIVEAFPGILHTFA